MSELVQNLDEMLKWLASNPSSILIRCKELFWQNVEDLFWKFVATPGKNKSKLGNAQIFFEPIQNPLNPSLTWTQTART